MQTKDEMREHCRFVGKDVEKSRTYSRLGCVVISIVFCCFFMGCNSKERRAMSSKMASLEDDLSLMSQRIEGYEQKMVDNSEMMKKIDDRLTVIEMAVRRLDSETGYMQSSTENVALALKRIGAIEKRLEKLENANESVMGHFEKLWQTNALKGSPKVSGDEYEKLVKAHKSLFTEVEHLSDKVKKLDDCINSSLGSTKISSLSWLTQLKDKIRDLEFKTMNLESEVRRLRLNSY